MADIITKNKKGTHANPRVDLTPMVDLGFLLISFFVFTSALTEPKAMTALQPRDGDETKIPESGAMTIIVGEDNKLLYYHGNAEEAIKNNSVFTADYRTIRTLIAQQKENTDLSKLMYLIKNSPRSTFQNSIDLLDEMAIADVPAGHYAEVELETIDENLLKRK